jgi:hypothetical protein
MEAEETTLIETKETKKRATEIKRPPRKAVVNGRPRYQKDTLFPLSFRVDTKHLTMLEEGASRLGISVHEYARIRLYDELDSKREEEILAKQRRAEAQLELLREDVASSLEIILLNTLGGAKEEDIRQWVSIHLRRGQE